MAAVGNFNSRFLLESHDHAGNFVAALPYRNAQGEWLLNERGSQLRIEIPYRGFTQVTRSNLTEGKHELWLYDRKVSLVDPIFGGPVWDINASGDSGILACSAQDSISYLGKRILKINKTFSDTQVSNDFVDLINYAKLMDNIAVVKVTGNTKTSRKVFKGKERNKITDLLVQLAAMDDGVEFYSRIVNNVHTIFVYGGKIKPSKPLQQTLEYGGTLDGYSVQYSAQGLANDVDIISSSTGRISNAKSVDKIEEYGTTYQSVEVSDQKTSTNLDNTATTTLADSKSSKLIPSVVTRKLIPKKDFDYGDQIATVIDDGYVQINQTTRITGWQLTIGQADKTTTVIYSKDTEGVS